MVFSSRALRLVGLFFLMMMTILPAYSAEPCQTEQVAGLKQKVLEKALFFKGQGDPDGSKQASFEPLIQALLKACPQPSVKERLTLVSGAWQQVWGPYTYRDDSRGVDPTLDPEHIYQVVFPGGYYYNVSPTRNKKGQSKHKTTLLRGEYRVDPKQETVLNVRFAHLRSVPGTPPEGFQYIDLPKASEAKVLNNQRTVLFSFLVRWLFGGGSLEEVYTDHDLRIAYGSDGGKLSDRYLYILKRVIP